MHLKRTHSNGIECTIAENSPQCTVAIKFKDDNNKRPAGFLTVRDMTVEEAKEFADDTVRNSGHLCTCGCSEWVSLRRANQSHFISVAVFDWEDPSTVGSVTDALSQYQSVVISCPSEEAVQAVIVHRRVDVVVLNLGKPLEKSFRLLSEIQSKAPQTEVIFAAQFDEQMLGAWMEVIQRGAYEFLPKPLDRKELKHHVVHAAEKHHPVKLRKRAPAESVKNLNTTSKSRPSAAGA